ncbi:MULTISPECIES: glycosyltransferase family 4 protein [unclassified Tolypothrix]|uniref:glycosyltransferase family 4 protein n=1 Tax=unclassified Tolypothrix TaxID=2649714 RepID=UPI0005EAB552|nr:MULTISPECIES: glycosyltransferase family 4 protein [unclassified Tolypothrix]BAY91942.1 group 1 glycosyl transferase [Microchaete diplosiphon NIES-3275]EKF04881.1 glycosyltransferase, group 1 family [Tolypothrix sp. PCC 7601]MBE9082722.1 glycosyltransferase family 4 protein [Tolypothrix sp. LEGE 11397]UYD25941.1 glycosyltransferase family 4 protein [Tolypothrix sp. PCC 7712]UYD31820.1 glycosyltransferase family 4 protein [Tolypothrix sp. PCC 7601]
MKVAFITHFPNLYGANRSLLNLIDGLKPYGVVPHIIAPFEGQLTAQLKILNIEYAVVPIQWWADEFKGSFIDKAYQIASFYPKAFKRLYLNFKLIPTLEEILKLWNIDVVYTNSSATPAGSLVAEKLQVPHIWHLREFLDKDYNLYLDWGKSFCSYFIQKSSAKIAISKAIASHFFPDCSTENLHIVYNGIASTEELQLLYQIGISSLKVNRPFTFTLVGLIHPNKGQDVAIKAFAKIAKKYPQVRLLIVGDGDNDYLDQLKKLTEDLGVLNLVEFWGYLEDPYKAYLDSDVILMCSKNEGMGRVTVEAMSVCRPVIGYDNAGTSEIIQHEYTGLLYRGDHEALAACMKQLIENPDWAKQLGMNAWKRVVEEYSIETYSQKIYEILLSVVTQHNISKQLIHI